MYSPATENIIEKVNYILQMSQFDQNNHLINREKQYSRANLFTHGFYVIRETEDGWWRESIDFRGDTLKQLEKLKTDPTIACGWINQPRFNEPGGWYDIG